jgi:hypothetical protein
MHWNTRIRDDDVAFCALILSFRGLLWIWRRGGAELPWPAVHFEADEAVTEAKLQVG